MNDIIIEIHFFHNMKFDLKGHINVLLNKKFQLS